MLVLATAATVIACQAVITGAFSVTQQAVQLGLLPRIEIQHTSETQAGQIYRAADQQPADDRRPAAGLCSRLVEHWPPPMASP